MKQSEVGRAGPLTWISLVLVLAAGLVMRLVLAGVAPFFLEGDSQTYLLPAWELARGEGFNPELRRTPGYPLLIAASFWSLGEDLERLALVQHLLGLATAGLTFLIARQLFGPLAGLLSGLAVALSGPQLIYERYVMTEALFGFALAALVLMMLAALRRPSRNLLLLGGLCIGMAALVRPVAQAVLPLFLLSLLVFLPRWRPALKAAGLALLGYALIIAPWTLRNLVEHETPAASGGLGRSLIARTVKYDSLFDWKWLSETYEGGDDLASRERMLLYRKRGNIPEGRSVRPYQDALINELGLTQSQAESAMREIAIEAIARRPVDYLAGSLLFTVQIFRGREESLQGHWRQRASKDWAEQWDNRLDYLATPLTPQQLQGQNVAAAVTDLYQPARFSWLLAVLFLLGSLMAWLEPARRPALLLGGITLTLLALSAFLDGPVPRYRYPLDPLILAVAAGGLTTGVGALLTLAGGGDSLLIWDRVRGRASARLAVRGPDS
jgi:4-amino-4-deoxy-L-arabinose transferase-like glycosyltransferase